MTASGIVPSTMVGRIRWLTAELKAPAWPDSSESISMKPVTGGKKNISEMRPETGVHCRMPEKRMISSRPHQKIGIEIADQRRAHDRLVEQRAALDGGEDAGRNAEHDGEDDGAERQLERRREQLEELRRAPASLVDDRGAEIAVQDAPEIVEILDDDRPVVAELVRDLGVALGRHDALARHQRDRIARQQADEGEGDDRDPDEGRDQDGKPSEEESKHARPSAHLPASRRRSRPPANRRAPACGERPCRSSIATLLGDVDAVEGEVAERALDEALDVLAHRHDRPASGRASPTAPRCLKTTCASS